MELVRRHASKGSSENEISVVFPYVVHVLL